MGSSTESIKKYINKDNIVLRRIVIVLFVIVGTLFLLNKLVTLDFIKVKTAEQMQEDVEKSKKEACGYEIFDNSDLTVYEFGNPPRDLLPELIDKGLDVEKWNKLNKKVQNRIIFEYGSKGISMEEINDKMDVGLEKFGEWDYSPVDVPYSMKDGKKIYEPTEEIKNADIPAIQFFDVYLPVNSSVMIRDAINSINNSHENLMMVEVEMKKRGSEDPREGVSVWEKEKYIVYRDTPENEWETNYLVKLKIDTLETPEGAGLEDYITTCVAVSDKITDNFYVSGAKRLNETGFFYRLKFIVRKWKNYLAMFFHSLAGIGILVVIEIAVLLVAGAIFFFPLFILGAFLATAIIYVLQIILIIIVNILSLMARIFGFLWGRKKQ